MQVSEENIFVDAGTGIIEVASYMESMPQQPVAGAYAFYDEQRILQFVGISQNLQYQFQVTQPAVRAVLDVWPCVVGPAMELI